MNRKTGILFLLFCILLPRITYAQASESILLISSYNSRFPTFFQQIDGIKSVLDPKQYDLDIEFMDSKRFADEETKQLFAKSLSHKLSNWSSYSAIITTDDNALNFVLEYQDSLFKDLPIVFCGVNNIENALEQNKKPDVTGIVELTSMKETIEVMLDLFPEQNTVYAIVDSTESGQSDLKTYAGLQNEFPNIAFKEIPLYSMTYDTYKETLSNIPANIPVLLLSAYSDQSKQTISFKESMSILNTHLDAPLFHLWEHGMSDGIFGGKIISHVEQGKKAATLIQNILTGERSISSTKVITSSPNIYIFDYKQLERFSISISQLPENVTIINKPETFYSKHKRLINLVVPIIFLLLIFIVTLAVSVL